MSEAEEMMNNIAVLRGVIMDHYQYPRNHSLVEDMKYRKEHMTSESCIDDITVQGKVENNVIQDIRFDGLACTISTASTSIMTELLKGKTVDEAKAIIQEYRKMLDGKEFDPEVLQEAVAFKNVYKQANRVHCASVGWDAIEKIIEESEKE